MLSTYLERKDISAAEFGRRIRVSRMTVLRYARGERVPPPDIMARIEDETAGEVTANDCLAAYRAWQGARNREGDKGAAA